MERESNKMYQRLQENFKWEKLLQNVGTENNLSHNNTKMNRTLFPNYDSFGPWTSHVLAGAYKS